MTTSAPPRPRQTKRGPGEPRHLILPSGIVSSGWPAVRDTSERIGIRYDGWQQEFNRALLAKDAQGLYAADTAVLSICRQSGKTFDVGGVVFADSIITPGTTTVWTAHRFKVSRESFNEMRAWARRPEMAPHIEYDDITTAAGNECIPFRNGSRILFAARERGAIRGFTKVRRLILDEAQILTEAAMSDLVPTTNQAENPQIILMGTPPKPSDPGEVFTSLRTAALAGELDGVLYIEFSADEDCDIEDWGAVAQANPSYPQRTSQRAVARLRKLLTNDDDYRREGLGIWPSASKASDLDVERWAKLADPSAERGTGAVFGVDVGMDRLAHVAVAWRRPDGNVQVMLADTGLSPLVAPSRLADLVERWHAPVLLGGPAASLEGDVPGATLVSSSEFAASCGRFDDLLREGALRHGNQRELNDAVQAARWRRFGSAGERSLQLADAPHVGPLAAVIRAMHGLSAGLGMAVDADYFSI